MSHQSTTSTVTFAMSQSEFHLLATFMAPLRFDEALGQSVWVSTRPDGGRAWTASANGSTSVITVSGDDTSVATDEAWSFPIPENMLVTIGKVFISYDSIILTLSDDTATITTEGISISMPQNPRAATPALPPRTDSVCSAKVDASDLWVVLSAARMWPAGGDGNGMNPPLECWFDIENRRLEFSVDWSVIGLGVHRHTVAATFGFLVPGATAPRFNFPHSAVLEILRDPVSCHRMGDIEIHASTTGEGYMTLTGENWQLHVPALPKVAHWGHDLDEVIDGIEYEWADCSLVHVHSPELAQGVLELRALPEGSGLYKYRVSYDVLDDVIPTIALYDEINKLNEHSTGCRLVVDGSRVKAVCDLTQENYEQLGTHVNAFARNVSGLSPLLGALNGNH